MTIRERDSRLMNATLNATTGLQAAPLRVNARNASYFSHACACARTRSRRSACARFLAAFFVAFFAFTRNCAALRAPVAFRVAFTMPLSRS